MLSIFFDGFKKYPKKTTPQRYEEFLKKAIQHMERERDMWLMYCDWSHEANAISLQARVRVILLTQLLGDGEEFSKKINQKIPKNCV